jgi:DNA-binding NarL/FixJ family response regulator
MLGIQRAPAPSAEYRQPVLRVLLVEPEALARQVLHDAASGVARVSARARFSKARTDLRGGAFDFLVTNVRLGAYNGLHLVYLAAVDGISTRSIVYSEGQDLGLALEVQRAGAFYETRECLPVTLTAYLRGVLPVRDRRDPRVDDRPAGVPGGRRRWDRHVASPLH